MAFSASSSRTVGAAGCVVGHSHNICGRGVEQSGMYVANHDFPEVDQSLLEPKDWKTVKLGMWRHTSEHITIKEGRALVLALRRLARSSKHRSRNHVFLLDNLALCFAVHKGRAHAYDMLRIMQQVGSICLAASLGVFPRWIPSEWNVADGPSRGQVSPGPFKKELVESAPPPKSSRVVAMRRRSRRFRDWRSGP